MTARDRIIIAVVCALAATLGSWLLVIQPKRQLAASLGKQVSAAQTELDNDRALLEQGEAARRAYAPSLIELARLGEAVPPDDNVPSLIYQLQGAATAAGVDFRSLVLQASSGSSPAPATTPGSTQAAAALAGSLPPGAAIGPAGFPEEQFEFSFNGNFFDLANFFKRLEDFVVASNKQVSISGRLMTLNAFSLGPGPQGFPSITASISATTYLIPNSQGLLNGASPAGPSAPGTQSVSGSASSSAPPTAAITP